MERVGQGDRAADDRRVERLATVQQHGQRGDGGVSNEAAALGGHKEIRQHQHQAEADHENFQTY